jgi:hypothetical protein
MRGRLHGRRAAAAVAVSLASLPFLVAIGPSVEAAPRCTGPFRFCDGCSVSVQVRTKKNTACEIRYFTRSGAVLGHRVTKRPRGIYGIANLTSAAYQPSPGFVGNDYFEVEIRYEKAGTTFSTTIKASVTVSE